MNAKSVKKRISMIHEFVGGSTSSIAQADKVDLEQEIFLALLLEDPEYTYLKHQVTLTALRILEGFRLERNAHYLPAAIKNVNHENVEDHTTPDLDLRLDISTELRKLPIKLRGVAEDFLYRGLTQEAVAEKYGKTQAWASKTKAKLRTLLSTLRERK